MDVLPFDLSVLFSEENLYSLMRAGIIAVVGYPVVFIVSRILGRLLKKRVSEHNIQLFTKITTIVGIILVTFTIMFEFGFNLTAFLGAAGIASVAIGFAAQTSLSNIISGIFVLWEKPFQVGDIIRIDDTMGVVLSIDLMSVKIKEFDNKYVRIPNENIIKNKLTNVTKFPIRRLDVFVGVSYKDDVEKVMRILSEVADKNPYSLDEPNPLIIFRDFGESSLDFLLGIWFQKDNYLKLKNSIMQDIKEAFDQEGITIPFPHRTLEVTEFPTDAKVN